MCLKVFLKVNSLIFRIWLKQKDPVKMNTFTKLIAVALVAALHISLSTQKPNPGSLKQVSLHSVESL